MTDPVVEFWAWFGVNSELVREAYNRGDYGWIDGAVTPLLEKIAPDITWEMGPYCLPHEAFVLSPTTRENLAIAKRAVSLAPAIAGWRFLPAKPAKELLSLEFVVEDRSVSADNWRYKLTSYNKCEFVDIEILFDAADAPPSEDADMFCELVVEALIGEELRLDRVGCLNSRTVDDVSLIKNAAPMTHLQKHLALVLAPIN
jgi:hypothetical protein